MADILAPQINHVITSRPTRIRNDASVHWTTEIVGMSTMSNFTLAELAACTAHLDIEDLHFMRELKHALREGLNVCEEFVNWAISQSG